MTKEEKYQLVEQLTEKFNATDYFYVVDAAGMTVAEVNTFRKACFEKGVEYVVIKNSLIKKVLEKKGVDYAEFDGVLKGFSGVMFAPMEAANAPGKLLKEFRKKNKKPLLKGASIDGGYYVGDDQIDALSKLKSKGELLGEIVGLLQSPAKNVLGALQSGGNKLAGIIKTLSEREGEGGEA